MPAIEVDPTLTMYYEDDCFADPWRQAEPALLIHGIAESSRAWCAMVPILAGGLRVLRVDQRGFGRSAVPPPSYPWSPSAFAADLARFLDALELDSVHVVGAKFGGSVALQFAADYPARTRTLSVLSSPVRPRHRGPGLPGVSSRIHEVGIRQWAAETMENRLGSEVPAAQVAWWIDFMASSDPRVCFEVSQVSTQMDLGGALPRILAPTLVVTTEASALASLETVQGWQQEVRNSELVVLPGDSYHVAAAKPEVCAGLVLDFIKRRGPHGG